MKSVTLRDRVLLWLCGISLLSYLLYSESVRAFGREFSADVSQLLTRL